MKVMIVLAILTITLTGATVYTYVDYLREPKTGLLISAYEVDQVPSYATVTTDPHPYVIEAIENPGEKFYIGVGSEEEEVAYQQVLHGLDYVEYEGKYYIIHKVFADLGLDPSIQYQAALGFSALGACWVVVGYAYHRENKRKGARDKKS